MKKDKKIKKVNRKELRELVKLIIEEYSSKPYYGEEKIAASSFDSAKRVPYDEKRSNKTYKLCIDLMSMDETTAYVDTDDKIYIYQHTQNSNAEISIKIDKLGFTINRYKSTPSKGYSNNNIGTPSYMMNTFYDNFIYDKILPIVNDRHLNMQINNFNQLIDNIYVDTKLSRNNNLNKILEGDNNEK